MLNHVLQLHCAIFYSLNYFNDTYFFANIKMSLTFWQTYNYDVIDDGNLQYIVFFPHSCFIALSNTHN